MPHSILRRNPVLQSPTRRPCTLAQPVTEVARHTNVAKCLQATQTQQVTQLHKCRATVAALRKAGLILLYGLNQAVHRECKLQNEPTESRSNSTDYSYTTTKVQGACGLVGQQLPGRKGLRKHPHKLGPGRNAVTLADSATQATLSCQFARLRRYYRATMTTMLGRHRGIQTVLLSLHDTCNWANTE
jgi:hypothetical protein